MSFEIVIPDLSKKGNCKDFIVEVLTENWPMTLKEIHNRIKKDFKYSGSYQSVFKSVNELVQKKVISKKDNYYELNISWIKKLQSFTDIVETNYYIENKKENKKSEKEEVVILNFSSLFDAEKYLYYFLKNELKKMKNKNVIYELNNIWKVLFYCRAEYNLYKKLMKLGHKFYFLFSGKSEIEKKAKEFYKKIGVNVKETKDEISIDTIIFHDYYIQIFVPEKLRNKISKYLEQGKEIELLETLDEEENIKVIVHREKDLVKNLEEKYLKKF
jgi:hypothetical protein